MGINFSKAFAAAKARQEKVDDAQRKSRQSSRRKMSKANPRYCHVYENDHLNNSADPGKRRMSVRVEQFTPIEISLVQKTWEMAKKKGMHEPGASILRCLFQKEPAVANLFEAVERVSNSLGVPHPQTENHFLRFNQLLNFAVDNLANLELCIPRLISLGRKHATIRHRYYFRQEYWDAFADAMVDNSLTWGSVSGVKRLPHPLALKAWQKVVLFIIGTMKSGFENEMKRLKYELNSRAKVDSVPDLVGLTQ